MISFLVSLVALILGYLLYGRFVEKVFGPDDRVTPAVAKADGLDYIVLPDWKIFMIQFLNIAGTGPIFGAIMGAKFGPVAYLWIATTPAQARKNILKRNRARDMEDIERVIRKNEQISYTAGRSRIPFEDIDIFGSGERW